MATREPARIGDAVFDRMLRGGLPRRRAMLVTGGPGTGKTTLGMQFLQTGLDAGEDCVFLSTEQTREELAESFTEFEFETAHRNLTVSTLHASPGDGDDGLRLRTLDGDTQIDRQPISFTMSNLATYLEALGPVDRLVLDSVSALSVMAESRETLRRRLLELIRVFTDRLEATALLTAEGGPRVGDDDGLTDLLKFTAHGVISLSREFVDADPHRFMEVEKLRGVDHDPRKVEVTVEPSGLAAAPARRSQPPELKTHAHTPIGIPGLDELCGGGLATGAGVLLEHDGQANLTALFARMMDAALERDHTIALVPTIQLRQSATATLLEGHGWDLSALLEDDRLLVLDMIGGWDESLNGVYGARETVSGVRSTLASIDDRVGDRRTFSLVNADAMVNTLGEEGARQVRYAREAEFLDPEDLMVHVHDPEVTPGTIDGFYRNTAEQVLRTWITDNGLQYVALDKSPCGFVGTTSLVEYTTEPPYLAVQEPPESRENPYALD